MRTYRLRAVLWSAAVASLVGCALAATWAARPPAHPSVAASPSTPEEDRRATERSVTVPLVPLTRLAAACAIDLRRPLYDPPPPKPVPPPPPPPEPPLAVKLSGTVIEPGGYSRAMLRSPDGKLQMAKVGDDCGGAKVVSIEQGRVEVMHNGKPVMLVVEKQR